MIDMSAIGWSRGRRGRARADRPSRPGRHVGSRGREAVTIISAPAGSGKASLLHAWAGRLRQDHRIVLMSVWPGQRDAQLVLARAAGEVRAATGGAESPPVAPEFNDQAMVDKVLFELVPSGGPFVLIIDDLHELSSGTGRTPGPEPRPTSTPSPRMAAPLRTAAGIDDRVVVPGTLVRQFEPLAELQQQGLIRHLGLSTVSLDQLAQAQRIVLVVCAQNF